MKKRSIYAVTGVAILLTPTIVHAQVAAAGVQSLENILQNVYNQMIPLVGNLLTVAQGVAGFGATFYIGYRVWKHIANAEPVDFFPLLRPFVLTILIGIFPAVLSTINGVLQPIVTATATLQQNASQAVANLLMVEQNSIGNPDNALVITPPAQNQPGMDKYSQPNSSGDSGGSWLSSGFNFLISGLVSNLRLMFRYFITILLEVLYFAAALCIDTVRIFHLIVLAILGPFVFAFSCYDGFQHTLTQWLARYINVFLWLPVANLFGAILATIQANMLQLDLVRIQNQSLVPFGPTDIAYMIFLVIGIIGYFTVPSVTNYIIHTHGPNPLLQNINKVATKTANAAVSTVSMAAGGVAGGAGGAAAGGAGTQSGGGSSAGQTAVAASQYNRDKIAG